jgi:hypothetical protein
VPTFTRHAGAMDEIKGTAALVVNDDGEHLLHLRDNIPRIWASGTACYKES